MKFHENLEGLGLIQGQTIAQRHGALSLRSVSEPLCLLNLPLPCSAIWSSFLEQIHVETSLKVGENLSLTKKILRNSSIYIHFKSTKIISKRF